MNFFNRLFFTLFILILVSLNIHAEGNVVGTSIYDFTMKNINGDDVSLSKYKNKVVLIVNVASYCGYTKQYTGLEELYKKYQDKGFEILAFPCNQFGEQEPGTNAEISQFCSTKYNVTFPIFDKIDVNGENAHPLYKYLKDNFKTDTDDNEIKWNFNKFLINKDGEIIGRYLSKVTPEDLDSQVAELLK